MSGVPRRWVRTTVGDVAELSDGPFGSNLKTSHYTDDGPRVVRLQNVGDGHFRDERAHIAPTHYERLAKHAVEAGDIVAASLGEEAPRACLVPPWLGKAIVKADCIRVRAGAGIEPAFLMWQLNSPDVRRQAAASIKGIGRPRLGLGGIRRLVIMVPPFAEQLRIVAAIDEQLSRLEAAAAAADSARRRIGVLRSRVLLSVIPDPMPSHWMLATVGEAGEIQLGRQRAPRYHTGPNMRPYLRVANVFEDRLDLEDVMRMEFSAEDYERYCLERGDILLNEGQSPELVGRPAMYRGELPDACFTNSLIRFRPSASVDGEFALLVFRRHLHAGRFQREARITTNIAHLSAGRLKSVEFPIPPLEEQREIVGSVHRSLSLITDVEAATSAVLRRERSLRRAILGGAFRGELVPQDPADEPASVLLERIAAERAASAPPRPLRRRVQAGR